MTALRWLRRLIFQNFFTSGNVICWDVDDQPMQPRSVFRCGRLWSIRVDHHERIRSFLWCYGNVWFIHEIVWINRLSIFHMQRTIRDGQMRRITDLYRQKNAKLKQRNTVLDHVNREHYCTQNHPFLFYPPYRRQSLEQLYTLQTQRWYRRFYQERRIPQAALEPFALRCGWDEAFRIWRCLLHEKLINV